MSAEDLATFRDGLHFDVPYKRYAAWPAVGNTSHLKRLRRSPLFFKAMLGLDEESTDDKTIGLACHCLLLESRHFDELYVISGRCVATYKTVGGQCRSDGSHIIAGKSYCGTHVKDVMGEPDPRTALSLDMAKRARDMADAVRGDPEAAAVLEAYAHREVVVLWTDQPTGLRCKGRIDVYGRRHDGTFGLWDLKKSRHAHPEEFPWEIRRLGYHQQLAWYDTGLRANGIEALDIGFLVVNDGGKKDAVHEVGVYDLVSDALELGRERNRQLLDLYAACRARERFPGFGRRSISVAGSLASAMDAQDDDDEQEERDGRA